MENINSSSACKLRDKILLNICLISPLPPPIGGISNWSKFVFKWLSKRRDINFTHIDIAPKWRSIDNTNYFVRGIGGSLQFLKDLCLVFYTLNKFKYDVIHLTTSGSLGLIRDVGIFLCARFFKVPIVYHIRFGRIPDIFISKNWEYKLLSWILNRINSVITIDNKSYITISKNFPRLRLFYLPNFISLRHLPSKSKISKNYYKALFLGWVVPAKGISELIESWSKINPKNWKLHIAGPGNIEYQEMLKMKYSPKNTKFLGELNHKTAIYEINNCDLFILPSYSEGFPNVILEAMALEKPIIATKVGAIPQMLDGKCGIIVKPKDVKNLTTAIKNVINNKNLRKEISYNAFEKVKLEYADDIVLKKLLNIWENTAIVKRKNIYI